LKEFILLNQRFEINSVNENQMAELAVLIGQILNGNDTLLLKGEIGAGKSYFSRKLIQSQQILPEEVPSPTFTLVQTYETSIGEIDLSLQLTSNQNLYTKSIFWNHINC
jgi:tRNA A37 threonylcarbamoyladenosine biosynthesis protein TsaE